MQPGHDLRGTPCLIDSEVADDVGNKIAGVVPRAVGRTACCQDREEVAEAYG
jgi:hypothetical protein